MDKSKQAKIFVIFTVLLWGSAGIISKSISMDKPFILLQITFISALIIISGYSLTNNSNDKPKIRKSSIQYLKTILLASMGFLFYWIFYINTLKSFDLASPAIVLNYTWPLFTFIFSAILFTKTKLNKIKTVGMILGFIAIIVLASEGRYSNLEHLNIKGIIFGLLTGISYGLYGGYASTLNDYEHKSYLLKSIIIAVIGISIMNIGSYHLFLKLKIYQVLLAIFLGLIIDGLGYIMWTKALQISKNEKIGNITSITYFLPIYSTLLISIYFKETEILKPYFFISLILVVLANYLTNKE